MPNWVITIETDMGNCPTASEIEEEARKKGVTPVELWKVKVRGELDTEIYKCHCHS